MESLEQNLIAMLQGLPIPVMVTWQSGVYHWRCLEEQGESPDLVGAVEEALRSMMRSVPPGASSKTDDNSVDLQ